MNKLIDKSIYELKQWIGNDFPFNLYLAGRENEGGITSEIIKCIQNIL